jgi:beta-lactamase class A
MGCTTGAPPAPEVPARLAVSIAADPRGAAHSDALGVTIDELVRPYEASVGVAYRVIETGDEYQLRGAESFPMASTYKFPMALTWLYQVDQGRLSLDQSIELRPGDLAVYHSPLADAAPQGGSGVIDTRW